MCKQSLILSKQSQSVLCLQKKQRHSFSQVFVFQYRAERRKKQPKAILSISKIISFLQRRSTFGTVGNTLIGSSTKELRDSDTIFYLIFLV
jgi:hypothetical protein